MEVIQPRVRGLTFPVVSPFSYTLIMLEDCFIIQAKHGPLEHRSTGDTWMISVSMFSSIHWWVHQCGLKNCLCIHWTSNDTIKSLSGLAVEYIWMSIEFLQNRHLSSSESPCLAWRERGTEREKDKDKHTHTAVLFLGLFCPSFSSPHLLSPAAVSVVDTSPSHTLL